MKTWHCLRCNARTDRSTTDRMLCVACVDKLQADQRKRCRGCNRFVSLDLFGVDRWKRDGLTTRCRSCRTRGTKAWQRRRTEHYRATQRRYRLERADQYRASERARRARDGDKRRRQSRESYARHREERIARDRERYKREREKRIRAANEYYQRNRERLTREKRERYQARKVAVLREIRGEQ